MKSKHNAILIGPVMGELYWEFGRFAPYIIGKKLHDLYKNVKFIIMTRMDRVDIYGTYADLIVPLELHGDNKRYIQDCFKLTGYPENEYDRIINSFHLQFMEDYNIVEAIRPNVLVNNFADRQQFVNIKNKGFISYDYSPRSSNKLLLDKILKNDNRPIIVVAPRFRYGIGRNWNSWDDFYDRINIDSMLKNYNFIICGKSPDYIPDRKKRFLDINDFVDTETSHIGLTIEVIKRAILTIGSQSAIPNISLLLKTPVMEWGHQRKIHMVDNNPFKVPIRFIDDIEYNIDHVKILHELKSLLEEKMTTNVGQWDCNKTNYNR